MKTANFPSLRVAHSLTLQIRQRRARRAFIERGLDSRDATLKSGEYDTADDVLRELDEVLAQAEAALAT